MSHDPDCLFCKIIAGHIPSKKVYEDEDVYAFHDIRPEAPIHFLMVPKIHITMLAQTNQEHESILGKMMVWLRNWRCKRAPDQEKKAALRF